MEHIGLATVSTIDSTDLIKLSTDIAQLNLGYLTVSVAILAFLGGVFIYFNFTPFKETLDKQEKRIGDLKEEADNLLEKARIQSTQAINDFKNDQDVTLPAALSKLSEKINLETKNKIIELESLLIEKSGEISEDKDTKLKEFILAEANNRMGAIEKTLIEEIKNIRMFFEKEIAENSTAIVDLKSTIKDLEIDTKELKVYKYAQEGKMGAIILSIELLKADIDEKKNSWRIPNRLEGLKNQIMDSALESKYVAQIEEQLLRIEGNKKYSTLISDIRKEASSSA